MSANQLKLLWTLTLLVMLVMLIYLANHLSDLMQVDEQRVPGCVMQEGSCQVQLSSGHRLRVSISPQPIVALQPVVFEVLSPDLMLESAQLTLTGKSMYMGIHQYTLQPGKTAYTLNVVGTISVCTENVMPWRGRLTLNTAKGAQEIWFDFDVLRP